MFHQPIQQVAMYALDVRAAALRHSQLYGSSPFSFLECVPWVDVWHRGKRVTADVSVALGKWGDIMLEFVGQTNDGCGPQLFGTASDPSVIRLICSSERCLDIAAAA